MLQKGNLRPIIMYTWNKGHDQDHKILRLYACNVILLTTILCNIIMVQDYLFYFPTV